MTKPLLVISKFTLNFTLFLLVTITPYMYFTESETETKTIRFSDNNIEKYCIDSPDKILYSECYKLQSGKVYSSIDILDVPHLYNLIEDIYERDLETSTSSQDKIHLAYIENWFILNDNLQTIEVTRNNMTFIHSLAIPVIRKYIAYKLKDFKDFYKNLNIESKEPKDNYRWKRIDQKVKKINTTGSL